MHLILYIFSLCLYVVIVPLVYGYTMSASGASTPVYICSMAICGCSYDFICFN